MNRKEVKNYYKKEVSKLTIILLKYYLSTGIKSRTFYLNELDQKLIKLQNRLDNYKKYPEGTRLLIESRIYIELLIRICELIEDYTGICSALWGNLKDYPKAIVTQKSPERIMKQFNDEKINILLRYAPFNEICLPVDEENLIKYIRKKNITFIKKNNVRLNYFLKLYWKFFNKHKHGNTLLYPFKQKINNGERTVIIPAIYNQKNPSIATAVIVNERIYEHWKTIFDVLLIIIEDIIKRTIMYIETGGILLIEYSWFEKLKKVENEHVMKIIKKHRKEAPSFNINPKVQITVERKILKKHLDILDK